VYPPLASRGGGEAIKIKYQNAKCKIKEVIAALQRFHNFDFCSLIFELLKVWKSVSEKQEEITWQIQINQTRTAEQPGVNS